ncbi:MAG: hypothetical protein NTY30_05010 [Candidatus Berkelbacteria bacterium]|nr:hypothetical protein [Candidatus Berkelbacteria bacterium]
MHVLLITDNEEFRSSSTDNVEVYVVIGQDGIGMAVAMATNELARGGVVLIQHQMGRESDLVTARDIADRIPFGRIPDEAISRIRVLTDGKTTTGLEEDIPHIVKDLYDLRQT